MHKKTITYYSNPSKQEIQPMRSTVFVVICGYKVAVSTVLGCLHSRLCCGSAGTCPARFMMVCLVMFCDVPGGKMGELEKWGEMGENRGNWGTMGGNVGAMGPRRPGMAWVGTRGAYYPLNHRWGYHPLPETLWAVDKST